MTRRAARFRLIDRATAGAIELTGCTWALTDYDDAGRAVRRWFAQMEEPGARHRRVAIAVGAARGH